MVHSGRADVPSAGGRGQAGRARRAAGWEADLTRREDRGAGLLGQHGGRCSSLDRNRLDSSSSSSSLHPLLFFLSLLPWLSVSPARCSDHRLSAWPDPVLRWVLGRGEAIAGIRGEAAGRSRRRDVGRGFRLEDQQNKRPLFCSCPHV